MDNLVLTAKELVFLASRLGAQNFFGLPDPFFGMDIPEIKRELTDLPLSLEGKGYASLGFDEVLRIDPQVAELVSVCALCEKYVAADILSGAEKQKHCLFYFRGEQTVELFPQGGGFFLRKISSRQAEQLVLENMTWPVLKETMRIGQSVVSFSALSQAQSLCPRDHKAAAEVLLGSGLAPDMAEILLDGLNGKGEYDSIVLNDFFNKEIKSVLCVSSPKGALRMIPARMEEQESWRLCFAKKEEISAEVAALFGLKESPGLEGADKNAGL